MVGGDRKSEEYEINFQYSLCRVVLMVQGRQVYRTRKDFLSVLALSSRFDGRVCTSKSQRPDPLSVLALSSRFDGQAFIRWHWICI